MRARRADGGGVAIAFALGLPVLCAAAVAGIQLAEVVSVRSRAQDVADNAALLGAQQLSLAPYQASERARAWALSELRDRASVSTYAVSARPVGSASLAVTINTYTPSFFGDLLPKGGFHAHVEAVAEQQSRTPLCVLIDGPGSDDVTLKNTSKLSGVCLLHSNHDVTAAAGASIVTKRTEAVGAVHGSIDPAGLAGAASIPDPFAALNLTFPGGCSGGGSTDYYAGVIAPGLFSKDINIVDGASVALTAGTYYVCGKLTVGKNASLTGSNVLLMFASGATMTAKAGSSVSLQGLRTGALAGFVLATARDATSDFHLDVDRFSTITGAIYTPAAKLVLDGSGPAAQASDWTVIAARALDVTGSANVVINTNYAASATPTPTGVGDRISAGVRLVR